MREQITRRSCGRNTAVAEEVEILLEEAENIRSTEEVENTGNTRSTEEADHTRPMSDRVYTECQCSFCIAVDKISGYTK